MLALMRHNLPFDTGAGDIAFLMLSPSFRDRSTRQFLIKRCRRLSEIDAGTCHHLRIKAPPRTRDEQSPWAQNLDATKPSTPSFQAASWRGNLSLSRWARRRLLPARRCPRRPHRASQTALAWSSYSGRIASIARRATGARPRYLDQRLCGFIGNEDERTKPVDRVAAQIPRKPPPSCVEVYEPRRWTRQQSCLRLV